MKNNHKTISPKVLRKNLFFYSASIFLIFSLFLILTITVPVYDRLKASENSKVIHDSEIRAMAVNEWSRRVKDLAFQITSRTRIRQELEKYNNGEISLTQLQSFTEPKLSDAMKLSEEIIGIVRLDRKGIPVAQCGEKFSYHDASIDYTKSFDLSLSKPFRRNGRCRVFVSAPIFNRLKVYVGADLVLIDLCFLEKIVNSESGFQKGHDTVLGYFSEGDVSILFKDKAENQNRIYKELIAPLLIKACHGESGINSNSFDHVTAYHSLGIKNWGLLVLQNKEDLYKTINTRFIYWGITAAIAYMAILAIFWFLTAPLANRLLIHTDELKETIKEKTTYLKDEIKERKKAEEKQKRTANFLSALLNAVPTPIFYKDKEGLYQGCNKEFSSFMGVTPDDIQGKRVDELWPGDQAVVYHQKDLDLMRNPCHQVYEFKVTDKNGEAKPVIFAKDVFRDEEGNVAGIIGAFSDISELKKTQEEIRSLRNYLSNIIDSMPSILIGVDNKTRITHWNIQARKRTRISQDSAKGQSLEKIFPQLPNGTEYVQKAIESRQVYHHSRSPRQEQSRTVYEDITIYPLVANGVEGAVVRIDDATERVQMEEMMTQTEKMLSVGGLAAGMAHEINNPLAGMMQSANVMKSRLENTTMPANLKAAEEIGISMKDISAFMEKRDIFRMIDAIHESGSRAAEIVSSMLNFARKSDANNMSSHYPDQLMDEILELAATDYDLKKKYDFRSIEIIKQYADRLPLLPCEGAKIQQVLLNILRNGAQAMQTAETECPRFIIRICKIEEPEMICMEIEDNGPGMDEDTRSKVFDPFFTTKPIGIGTGLGLSVSYFIITENHKGTIDVISEPGKGANFKINIPIKY